MNPGTRYQKIVVAKIKSGSSGRTMPKIVLENNEFKYVSRECQQKEKPIYIYMYIQREREREREEEGERERERGSRTWRYNNRELYADAYMCRHVDM